MFLHGSDRFSHVGGAFSFFAVATGSLRDGTAGIVKTAGTPRSLCGSCAPRVASSSGPDSPYPCGGDPPGSPGFDGFADEDAAATDRGACLLDVHP